MLYDTARGYREGHAEADGPAGARKAGGANEVPSRDPMENVKRKVYLCSLVISAPALPLLWLTRRHEDPFILFAFPPMALFCLWCTLALWLGRMPMRGIERLTFAAVSTFALLHLIHSLSTAQDFAGLREAADMTTFPTLIVMYVIAYLVFDTKDGLGASLMLYAASLALVGAGAFAFGLANLDGSDVAWLAQTCAFMGAVIALLYATAYAKTGFSRERALAEAMSRLALTDQLTGIANRRKLYADLRREVEAASRYDHPLSVVLFDLDHFKQVNDVHGHAHGDAVLREVARTITPLLRKSDHFGRWGGEEFILLTPETGLKEASMLAERLRRAVSANAGVTASFGVSGYAPDDSPESLTKRADEALYVAKARGRNRVCCA